MEDEIKTLSAVHLMDRHHEAVSIFVSNLRPRQSTLGLPARIIGYDVPPCAFEELRKIAPTNGVERARSA